MKLRIAGKIIILAFISILICSEQVYAAKPSLRSKKPVKPKTIIEQISSYISSNQTQNALNLLNKAVLKDPYNPKIFSMAADLFYKNSQYSEVEMLARKALSLNPKDNSCYLILGNVLLKNYEISKSYSTLSSAEPNLNLLYESIKCFNFVSENDPASALPHIGLARVYLVQNNQSKLYDELLKAKELAGNDSSTLFEIGKLFYLNGCYEKAIQYLKKSISVNNTDNYRAHALLAEIHEKLGNFGEAQNEYISTLNAQNSQPEIKDKIIELNSKIIPVMDTSQTVENIQVNSEITNILQADNFLGTDRFSEARNIYLKILQNNQGNIDALSGLSELYYTQWMSGYYDTKKYYLDCPYFANTPQDLSKISAFKFKLVAEPEITGSLEDILTKIANSRSPDYFDQFDASRAMFLLGNYISAKIKLQELLTEDISDYDKFKMAKMLYYDQNFPEADSLLKKIKQSEYSSLIKTFEDRISFKQAQTDKVFEEGLALYKDEKYKDAILKFEDALKFFPTHNRSHLYYAYALQKAGRTEKAVEEINIYMNLELIYPSKKPELRLADIKKIIISWENKK
jgi:tetratricopeptide (TPR) repeat protein